MNLAKYFKDEDNSVRFIGSTCTCTVPAKFRRMGLFEQHADRITTLGLMEITVDDRDTGGLFIAAAIDMQPATVSEKGEYIVFTFNKNDTFIMSKEYVKNEKLPYIIWSELIANGRLPKFINYDNAYQILSRISDVTGVSFNTPKALEETIFAHLFRDKDRPFTKYRHTAMDKDPIFVGLKTGAAFGPDDTLSKLLGSYESDSLNSALINESDQSSPIEIVLRA